MLQNIVLCDENVYAKDDEEHTSLGKMIAYFWSERQLKKGDFGVCRQRAGLGSFLIGIESYNTNTLNLDNSKLRYLGHCLLFWHTNVRLSSYILSAFTLTFR